MTILFLSAAAFCLYTYIVFPLVLHLLAMRQHRSAPPPPVEWPSVSIVIAAHNEEQSLKRKFESLRDIDYPGDSLEVVFVSDGSTDNTLDLLTNECERTAGWFVRHYAPASGKPTALNIGVAEASGDILVFMDARQQVSSNAVKALVTYLQDSCIGAVSGELVLADSKEQEAMNVGLYWRYEKWIRQNESRLYSTTGATGALYAIRRADYTPHGVNCLLDDFDTPIRLLAKRKRTVFAPEARAYDKAESDGTLEFQRKVRTLAGNLQSFRHQSWLFNPIRNPVWWQFLSHKVFRLLLPYAMSIALLSSAFGDTPFLNTMFFAQLVFYALGIAAWLDVPGMSNRLSSFIKVFLQLTAATVVGTLRYITRRANVRWK